MLGALLLALALPTNAHAVPDALAPTDDTFTAAYLSAFHAAAENDPARAADLYLKALAHDPDNASLAQRTYYFLTLAGRVSEAADVASDLITLQSDGIIAHLLQVTDTIAKQQYDDARFLLASLPNRPYSSFIKPMLGGWIDIGAGDAKAAYVTVSTLKEQSQAETLYHFHAGLIAEQAGNLDHANAHMSLLVPGIASHPLSVLDALTAYHHRQGNLDEARALITAYQTENPDAARNASGRLDALRARLDHAPPAVMTAAEGSALALFSLSRAFLSADRGDMAQIFARLGQHLYPNSEDGERLLIQCLIADHQFSVVRQRLENLADISADPLPLLLQAVEMRDLTNDRTGAMKQARTLSRDYSSDPRPWMALADLHRQNADFGLAVKSYDTAFKKLGSGVSASWSLLYARGMVLERAGMWGRAEADFRAALQKSPNHPLVLNYLGYSLLDRGEKMQEARDMIELAVRQRPHDGMIVDSLGWAMFLMGEIDDAVIQLERAAELEPLDPAITDHLGDAYWTVGRRIEARFQWQRALDMDPEPALAQQIEAKLENGLHTPPARAVAADQADTAP